MPKKTKLNLEFLLVKAELKGVPEKGSLRSRNIWQVDLIWPRTGGGGGCLDRINRIDRIIWGIPRALRSRRRRAQCGVCAPSPQNPVNLVNPVQKAKLKICAANIQFVA